ncbi:RGG repeats nuclear RNA binding protein A-like [Andrographis paniculata]|uniref:RGG repeats nuclear RNA binding protein A-like n=1 Tax=Andrographis paniculata TaxID=175694 RepID=UPI0021E8DDB0|nr:RGG repeats nuclear RNA binding protein A-like [Andrographis paniculata]
MASLNPFDLLGDDDAEDPTLLLAAQQKASSAAPAAVQPKKAAGAAQPAAKAAARLPSKPLPPAQAVKESRNEGGRGGRGGGRGRGGRGFNRDFIDNGISFGSNGFSDGYKPSDEGDGGRAPSERRPYGGPRGGGGFRGGRRGGFSNGESADGERPRRTFDRRSGSGRGTEIKRDGAGRGNWGAPSDEIAPETEEPISEEVKNADAEKQSGLDDAGDANKDSSPNEAEEKEPEEKEMTLEEYERLLEEKRKALLPHKSEERKVELDKELKSMQLLSNKKNDDEVFIKLGSEKDKRREAAEKAKKSVSINEFLKPADGENYRAGGRGRGRGRGGRGGFGGSSYHNMPAPVIEDSMQFPALVAK